MWHTKLLLFVFASHQYPDNNLIKCLPHTSLGPLEAQKTHCMDRFVLITLSHCRYTLLMWCANFLFVLSLYVSGAVDFTPSSQWRADASLKHWCHSLKWSSSPDWWFCLAYFVLHELQLCRPCFFMSFVCWTLGCVITQPNQEWGVFPSVPLQYLLENKISIVRWTITYLTASH